VKTRALLERSDELDAELLGGLLQTWVTYLEDAGRCDEAAAVLESVPIRNRLAALEEFGPWLSAHSDTNCSQTIEPPVQPKGNP
jgi:hypothetical protein